MKILIKSTGVNEVKQKRKKENSEVEHEYPLYLNKPIESDDADWIGVSSYVNQVHEAIKQGAEMIAVIAEYGSGKSSVTELLETRIKKEQKNRHKFIRVNLWAHSTSGNSPLDLHKSLIYQIVSQISTWKGSYITKRLSKNYGLLKITTGSWWYLPLMFCALLLAIGARLYDTFYYYPESWIVLAGYGIAVTVGIVLLFKADILFSFKESVGNRDVDENEILDLYRSIVWKYGKKLIRHKHYIIVIEDLDRTEGNSVSQFLKELRKYSLPFNKKEKANNVCFVVNVKPEVRLSTERNYSDGESFYSKVFDFSVDLRTVNIDNFDVILRGLINEKLGVIENIGLELPKNDVLAQRGMQWIIRGKTLGLRTVKERLNHTFVLYESLVKKFGKDKIEFEKCAVAVYVINAFPSDFYAMNDMSFQELLGDYFVGNLKKADDYRKILPENERFSDDFIDEIKLLIENKLIDNTYKTYFYQYPEGSNLYNVEENAIWNSIVYRESYSTRIVGLINSVSKTNSDVIVQSLHKVKDLGLTLPRLIFSDKTLFSVALKFFLEETLRTLEKDINYDDSEIEKTVEFYRNVVGFDHGADLFPWDMHKRLCEIWEKMCSQTALMKLRLMICKNYPCRVLLYIPLFSEKYPSITSEEISFIEDAITAIEVVNANLNNINITIFEDIHNKIMSSGLDIGVVDIAKIEKFYESLIGKLDDNRLARPFIDYMVTIKRIVPKLEDVLRRQIEESGNERKYIGKYIEIINAVDAESLDYQTFINIKELMIYSGFSAEVRRQLYNHQFYVEYIFSMVNDDIDNLDLADFEVQDKIESEREFMYDTYPEIWMRIRLLVIEKFQKIIDDYIFMFGDDYPYINEYELGLVDDVQISIKLFNSKIASEDDLQITADFFNKSRLTREETSEILRFITNFESALSYQLFYLVNMQNTQYKNLAKAKRDLLRSDLYDILVLNNAAEALKFMAHTGVLDETLEKGFLETLKTDSGFRENYVELINKLDKPTLTTITNIAKMGTVYAYSPKILEKLYERKMYRVYILSSTKRNNSFIVEEDTSEELWASYIDILKNADSYKCTKSAMAQNMDFLDKVSVRGDYIDFPESSRIFFTKLLQDQKNIKNILTYDADFIEKYFSQIEGFYDRDSAELFVEKITSSDELIKSQSVYDNTHSKLIDPGLKAKYTRLRNKVLG